MSLVTSLVLSSGLAMAAQTPSAALPQNDPACSGLKEACQKAGYVGGPDQATGKGSSKDCMEKVASGIPVEGVPFTAEDPTLATCKAVMATSRASQDSTSGTSSDKGAKAPSARKKETKAK